MWKIYHLGIKTWRRAEWEEPVNSAVSLGGQGSRWPFPIVEVWRTTGESQKFRKGLGGDRKLVASRFSVSRAVKHDRLFKHDTLAQEQRRLGELSRKVGLYLGASGGQVTAEGRTSLAPRLIPFALPVKTKQRWWAAKGTVLCSEQELSKKDGMGKMRVLNENGKSDEKLDYIYYGDGMFLHESLRNDLAVSAFATSTASDIRCCSLIHMSGLCVASNVFIGVGTNTASTVFVEPGLLKRTQTPTSVFPKPSYFVYHFLYFCCI